MNKIEVVVDTNVAVVANYNTEQASLECEAACIQALKQIQAGRRTLLDEMGLILKEYRNNLHPSGQPGVGDAFCKWVHDNQATDEHCRTVSITVHADRGFVEFPDDARLSSFDLSDRKFVAVALASGTDPQILNASDTDWWHDRQTLAEHGIQIVFLCPELMQMER